MSKNVLIVLASLFSFINGFSQNYNWITPNKTYLKMYVSEDGMYRINKTDFTNAGIVSVIDPRTIKLYNKGTQIPIYFSGESDGTFDPADYFDFYGTRNYGGVTKTYDHNNNLVYTTNEYFNSFSDTNVYWVDWGGSFGVRYTLSNNVSDVNYNPYFYDIVHKEQDLFYSEGETFDPFSDFRFLSTEKFRGEGWYWQNIADNQTLSDTFSIPYLYSASPQNATIRIFAYSKNRNTSILNEHTLQVRVNNNLVGTLYANDLNRMDSTITFSSSLLSAISVNTISVKYVPAPGSSGSVNVDLMEVKYPRTFSFNSARVGAALNEVDTTSKLISVNSYISANPLNIYDVNNYIKVNTFQTVLDTLKFTGKGNGKFEVINTNITKKPFRIKQRMVPDFLNASNGADYLVIYHNLFTSQAEQLRAYRQTKDNFRSYKAEIEDIYDVFNYGIENPVGVRNFTTYVYNNWQLPKLSYICLLGRASLDPKKNLSTSSYYQNLIPTYGSPPSDGYFANFNIGTFFYYDMVAIGRLPAYSVSEAQSMVDKIIAYESNPPARWHKNFTFITGGGSAAEQTSHQSKSEFEISLYVNPAPLAGEPHRIYRSDTSGNVTFNIKDSVKNDIDRGTFFVNFRGHAGSHDWEVAMSDPNTLDNGSKLPLVLSMTCFTGENSKPNFRGFGEKFLYLSNKGAIGFVGTTGWSYGQQGNDFGTHIMQTMKTDTARRLGNMTKYANKKMSADSLAFQVRHTINCYTLTGDPATTLNFPVRPDFAISNSDYKLSNTFPNIGENVTLTIYPKNFGTNGDSLKIRMQVLKNGQSYFLKDSVKKQFKLQDSISYTFKIDSTGQYSAVVTLEQANWYPLEYKANNSITINIPTKNVAFAPLKPVNNSIVNTDTVEFVGVNPRMNLLSNSVKLILQVDTSTLFNSPLAKTFVNNNPVKVNTKFKSPVPLKVNNKLHYWRTNCIINGDSSDWSDVQKFVYQSTESPEKINAGRSIPTSSVLKVNSGQYNSSDYVNTTYLSSGIQLTDYATNLYVRSFGSNAEEASYFSIGNKNIYIDGGMNTGLNLLKVKKLTGSIMEFKNLKMINATLSNDSLVNFLNTFDTTHYLMMLNAAYVSGAVSLNTAAKNKLKQFGSIYCDSIGLLGYFHTWSLIGYLGATSVQASEMFDPCCRPAPGCVQCNGHWMESTSTMDAVFRNSSGSVSNLVGPASGWSDFSWTQTLSPNSTIKFDVYGINDSNQQVLLFQNLQNYQFNDLSSINAETYPYLNFITKIQIDSITGGQSSVLNSFRVNYTPAPEIQTDINSFKYSINDRIGSQMKFSFDYYNNGFINTNNTLVSIYKYSITPGNMIFRDTVEGLLKMDSMKSYVNAVPVPKFRDDVKLIVEAKPVQNFTERYSHDNSIGYTITPFYFEKPNINVEVFSDGQILKSGDYVNPKPEIRINISGSEIQESLLNDTDLVSIHLNDKYIPYFGGGKLNSQLRTIENDNSAPGSSVLFYPDLSNGTNKLTLIYKTGTDNRDTLSYDVIVTDELAVKEFYNYPNPMKTETSFIFTLTGSFAPDNFKIKIYTINGRLIKEIDYPARIGTNKITWDGKDVDGDLIANGTYLFKLVAEGDEKLDSKVQKLVVLR